MKLLIFFILSTFVNYQTLDIDSIRNAYKETVQNKANIELFYNQLSEITTNDTPEKIAYKGAATALMARQAKTIKEKKTEFLNGIALVEYAIEKEPNNIEARLVRLSIQENTPKFLKYKQNIESDKEFIYQNFQSIKSASLKNYLKAYILQSKAFNDEEKSVISKS